MKPYIALILTAWLTAGCATTVPRPDESASRDLLAPATEVEGRITLVNKDHGFVVLEFRGATVPAAGTVLDVYRDDQSVAQVRVTEPARGSFTSGDILTGTPQVGDRARATP